MNFSPFRRKCIMSEMVKKVKQSFPSELPKTVYFLKFEMDRFVLFLMLDIESFVILNILLKYQYFII